MNNKARSIFKDGYEIITLKHGNLSAKIAVNIGNTMFSLSYKNQELLYFPFLLSEYAHNAELAGNPFMHPWANRLEGEFIHIENKKYNFPKQQLHLLYRDKKKLPLHGLLLKSNKWKTIELYEDTEQCSHSAELVFDDEQWLFIFPFKHTITIKHQLKNNTLSIKTTITHQDKKCMPISFGFHPYFLRKTSNSKLTVPMWEALEVNEYLIPTGKLIPKEQKWDFNKHEISLQHSTFDDGFFIGQRNDTLSSVFKFDEIQINMDEHYPYSQIYVPNQLNKPYVCIEPMTAATNALNANTCKCIKEGEQFSAEFSIAFINP